jgi:predicted DNA binding CopG/RHH family protein
MIKKLDKREQEILESLERGEWKSVKNLKEEIKKARAQAIATAKKDARMNLRLSRRDIIALKSKALEEGIPYQTLVAGIIHKYVEGRLKEV